MVSRRVPGSDQIDRACCFVSDVGRWHWRAGQWSARGRVSICTGFSVTAGDSLVLSIRLGNSTQVLVLACARPVASAGGGDGNASSIWASRRVSIGTGFSVTAGDSLVLSIRLGNSTQVLVLACACPVASAGGCGGDGNAGSVWASTLGSRSSDISGSR